MNEIEVLKNKLVDCGVIRSQLQDKNDRLKKQILAMETKNMIALKEVQELSKKLYQDSVRIKTVSERGIDALKHLMKK